MAFAGAKQIQKFLEEWGKPQTIKTDSQPSICDLCGIELDKEEDFYVGWTRGNVLAYTCLKFDCVKWLEVKARVRS